MDAKLGSRVATILAALDAAASPLELAIPSYRLHELRGSEEGVWSVRVNKNWRITFRFEGSDACDVNLIDYH